MRNEPITGRLAGEYRTLLAADSYTQKRLWAVLTIDEKNGWHTQFIVGVRGATRSYGALSEAIREYDKI